VEFVKAFRVTKLGKNIAIWAQANFGWKIVAQKVVMIWATFE
jgi:hypothetical protein